jgi:uncharacterized lipoprotein YbaY
LACPATLAHRFAHESKLAAPPQFWRPRAIPRVAMKNFRLLPLLAPALLFALTGCKNLGQYVDTTPQPTGNQVLHVTVGWPAGITLPADAAVAVLLLDDSNSNTLATQRLEHPGSSPVAFQLAYKADDLQPPHRVRLEARISIGGQLRYTSGRQRYFVTTANAADSFALTVAPLSSYGASGVVTPAGTGNYLIKAGDTLASIAQLAGVSLMELVLANPGLDAAQLKVGQKINLPTPP